MRKKKERAECHTYFVDEAGDLTLFDKQGRPQLGKEGVSSCFMLGLGFVDQCETLHDDIERLRTTVLSDPDFQTIESLKPERKKTALQFHAKDDHPKVRAFFFERLPHFGMKVFAAVRRKDVLLEEARIAFRYGRKITDELVYDDLLKRLLRDRLHLADRLRIYIAVRGTKERRFALLRAAERAKRNFEGKFGSREFGEVEIIPSHPRAHAGLQAVDYYLWALQRMYERREETYLEALREGYRLVMDLDDKRKAGYGEWYSDGNPISAKKISSS